MAYLVDSDVLIDMSRGNVAAGHYVNSLADWSLSIVSGMELLAGAKDKNELANIDIMLACTNLFRSIPRSANLHTTS